MNKGKYQRGKEGKKAKANLLIWYLITKTTAKTQLNFNICDLLVIFQYILRLHGRRRQRRRGSNLGRLLRTIGRWRWRVIYYSIVRDRAWKIIEVDEYTLWRPSLMATGSSRHNAFFFGPRERERENVMWSRSHQIYKGLESKYL